MWWVLSAFAQSCCIGWENYTVYKVCFCTVMLHWVGKLYSCKVCFCAVMLQGVGKLHTVQSHVAGVGKTTQCAKTHMQYIARGGKTAQCAKWTVSSLHNHIALVTRICDAVTITKQGIEVHFNAACLSPVQGWQSLNVHFQTSRCSHWWPFIWGALNAGHLNAQRNAMQCSKL